MVSNDPLASPAAARLQYNGPKLSLTLRSANEKLLPSGRRYSYDCLGLDLLSNINMILLVGQIEISALGNLAIKPYDSPKL
jgi:hypothetical protein